MKTETLALLRMLPELLKQRVEILSQDAEFEPFHGDEIRMLTVANIIFKATKCAEDVENFQLGRSDLAVKITSDQYSLALKVAQAMHKDAKTGICVGIENVDSLKHSETLLIESVGFCEIGNRGFCAFPREEFISQYVEALELNRFRHPHYIFREGEGLVPVEE